MANATEKEVNVIVRLKDQFTVNAEKIAIKQKALKEGNIEGSKAVDQMVSSLEKQKTKLTDQIKAYESYIAQNKNLITAQNGASQAAEKLASQQQKLSTSTGGANSQLTAMGRIIQDAPYGLNAISNNISNTIEQMGYLVKSTGSVGGAMSALSATLFSTSGILIALAALPGVIQFFRGTGQEAKTAKGELEKMNEEFQTTINLRDELLGVKFSFANSEEAEKGKKILEAQNKAIQENIDIQKKALAGNVEYEKQLGLIASGVQGVELSTGKLSRAEQDATKARILYSEAEIKSGQSAIDKITEQIEKQKDLEREINRIRSAGGNVDIKVTKQGITGDSTSRDLYYQMLEDENKIFETEKEHDAFLYEESVRHEIEIQQLKQEGIIANNEEEILTGYEILEKRRQNVKDLYLWSKKYNDELYNQESKRIEQFEARGQADADRRKDQLAQEEVRDMERAKRSAERWTDAYTSPLSRAIIEGKRLDEALSSAAENFKAKLLDAVLNRLFMAAIETIASILSGGSSNSFFSLFKESGGYIPARESGGFVPQFAESGGSRGGLVTVGERGQETVRLPSGSQVYSAGETREMGKSLSVVLNFGDDMLGVVKGLKREMRQAGVSDVNILIAGVNA